MITDVIDNEIYNSNMNTSCTLIFRIYTGGIIKGYNQTAIAFESCEFKRGAGLENMCLKYATLKALFWKCGFENFEFESFDC